MKLNMGNNLFFLLGSDTTPWNQYSQAERWGVVCYCLDPMKRSNRAHILLTHATVHPKNSSHHREETTFETLNSNVVPYFRVGQI